MASLKNQKNHNLHLPEIKIIHIIQLAKLILSFLLIFLLPILLLLVAPMHLCRFFIQKLAKILRPDLNSIVSCSANTIANASNTLKNPRLAIVATMTYKGKIELEELKELFTNKCLNLKRPNGAMKYPELKQSLTSWMGFRFWRNDKNFDLKNHVNVHENNYKQINLDDLKELEAKIMIKEFHPDRSPWRCTIVHNVELSGQSENNNNNNNCYNSDSNNTALIYTFAHVLCDGYSLIKLVESLSDFETSEQIKPKYTGKSLWDNLILPFKCIYVFAEIIVDTLAPYPFKVPRSTGGFEGNLQMADVISTNSVKEIKNLHGVSFTSVVFSIATGAFREMAIESGTEMTDTIPCVIPFPRPGHPENLCNHFTMAVIKLPIGESDPIKRLKLCHKEFERIRSSAYPLVVYLWFVLCGGCFNFIGRILTNTDTSVFISYLPMSWSSCSVGGHDLLAHRFCYAQSGSVGCAITIISLFDDLRMCVIADGSVLSKQQVSSFRQIVNGEVEKLK